MPSYRILFNSRRVYFFEAHRPVIEKLIHYGHQPVIAPMQTEQDEIFRSYFEKKNYSYRLLDAETAAAKRWDLVVLSGRRYEREYLHPQNLVILGHGGCGGGNSAEPYRLASFKLEQMKAYLANSVAEIDLGERLFPGIWEDKIVRIVGWPKLDRVITDGAAIRTEMQ